MGESSVNCRSSPAEPQTFLDIHHVARQGLSMDRLRFGTMLYPKRTIAPMTSAPVSLSAAVSGGNLRWL